MTRDTEGFSDTETEEVVCVRNYTCVCTPDENATYICNVLEAVDYDDWATITATVGLGNEECIDP